MPTTHCTMRAVYVFTHSVPCAEPATTGSVLPQWHVSWTPGKTSLYTHLQLCSDLLGTLLRLKPQLLVMLGVL